MGQCDTDCDDLMQALESMVIGKKKAPYRLVRGFLK